MTQPRRLMIVMYHYVRRIAGSRYPGIKGRETDDFARQIAYLARYHRIVAMDEVIAASRGASCELPDNAVLLTFDDGYIDHFSDAFPILQRFGVSGSFFVPIAAITERRMLDVNKVHFLLASGANIETLVAEIEQRVESARTSGMAELQPLADYRATYRVANRFDPADVIYTKRMLQHALPERLKQDLLNDLFRRWVTGDERDFADQLYMSESNLRAMSAAGMTIGAHSANHLWLDRCDIPTQATEIAQSAAFLKRLGLRQEQMTFCYPYGAYNDDTVRLLRQNEFAFGVTTKVDLALVPGDDPLLMPRLDTNDLPIAPDAAPNRWSNQLRQSSAVSRPSIAQ